MGMPVSLVDPSGVSIGAPGGGVEQFLLISAASTNATVIKAGKGRVFGYHILNQAGAAMFVKLYDKATAPDQNDVPVRVIGLPAGSSIALHAASGLAGFDAGIALRTTTGILNDDNAAVTLGALAINIDYV